MENEQKCPMCGKPLSLEFGTYYCHWCNITIDPSVLQPKQEKQMATKKRLIDAEKFLQWLVKRFKCVPLIGSHTCRTSTSLKT